MRYRLALDTPAAASGNCSTRALRAPGTRNPFAKRALRRNADAILQGGASFHRASALLAWRAAELTSPRRRQNNARSLRGVVREFDARSLAGAVPLDRAGVRPHEDTLSALAERVGDLSRPVAPRGILLLEDLLSNGAGPLYARANSSRLADSLDEIDVALGKDAV